MSVPRQCRGESVTPKLVSSSATKSLQVSRQGSALVPHATDNLTSQDERVPRTSSTLNIWQCGAYLVGSAFIPARRASREYVGKEPRYGMGAGRAGCQAERRPSPEAANRARQTFHLRSGQQVPDFTSWPAPRAATTAGKGAGCAKNRTLAAWICEEATESLESKYLGCSTDRSRLCGHKECNACTEATKSLSQLSTC